MIECNPERRTLNRRVSDRRSPWTLHVALGVLFIIWSSIVYLHSLIPK